MRELKENVDCEINKLFIDGKDSHYRAVIMVALRGSSSTLEMLHNQSLCSIRNYRILNRKCKCLKSMLRIQRNIMIMMRSQDGVIARKISSTDL